MGKDTKISWATHTFNPWRGCEHVSPACDNCYAEALDGRFGGENWGPGSPRKFFSDAHWHEPVKWNAEAKASGVRPRVFCASTADVFEDRRDLDEHRARLWRLVHDTPDMDWLFLTKRIQNAAAMIPDHLPLWNVWLGVTAENEAMLRERVHILRSLHAAKHFISCEPILEHISASAWDTALNRYGLGHERVGFPIDWLIVGDESGRRRRPAQVDWIRTAREAALRHGVAFHFKQWVGINHPDIGGGEPGRKPGRKIHLPILDNRQHAAIPE